MKVINEEIVRLEAENQELLEQLSLCRDENMKLKHLVKKLAIALDDMGILDDLGSLEA